MVYFEKAPIVEAIIEVRFSQSLSKADWEKITRRLPSLYKNETPQIEFTVEFQNGVVMPPASNLVGQRKISEDQLDIVILLEKSVAVARLAPYPGWSVLYDHFTTLWGRVEDVAGRLNPTRIGVRFSNRLDIPWAGIEPEIVAVEKYLRYKTEIPCDGAVVAQNTQLVVQTSQENWFARIAFGQANSPLLNHSSILLDIDVYREKAMPTRKDEFLELVHKARDIKNEIFLAFLTEEAKTLIS